jgi:hypothetical protein
MKTMSLKFAVILMAGIAFTSCKKSTPASPAPAPVTNTTTPSFVATVSGSVVHFTGAASNSTQFSVSGTSTNYIISIGTFLQGTGTVTMDGTTGTAASITQIASSGNTTYMTDNTHTGVLTITAYDATKKMASGTFSFTAVATSGSTTMSVTSGSFTNIKWN